MNQISVAVVLSFLSPMQYRILFDLSWIFFPVSQVVSENLYLRFIYYLFRVICKCFYPHVKFSVSIPTYLVFKVKMSIIDPLACGVAKVVVFSILCVKDRNTEEEWRERKRTKEQGGETWISTVQRLFNFVKFHTEYRKFIQDFKKIIGNIKSLEKYQKDTKTEILQTFSISLWQSLSDTEKSKHSLVECKGWLENWKINEVHPAKKVRFSTPFPLTSLKK